jgi:hypothetical protein
MGNAPPPPEPRQAFAIQDHLDDARRGVVPRPPPGLVQGLRDEGPELGLLRAKVLDLETRLDRAERAIRDQSDLEGRLLRSETLLKKVCDTMVIDDVDYWLMSSWMSWSTIIDALFDIDEVMGHELVDDHWCTWMRSWRPFEFPIVNIDFLP